MNQLFLSPKAVLWNLVAFCLFLALAHGVHAGTSTFQDCTGPARSVVGSWATKAKLDPSTEVILGLSLGDTGRFRLIAFDIEGKHLGQIDGSYTYTNGQLRMFVDGKKWGEVRVTRSQDRLLFHGEQPTEWVRMG
jgi:hypothetical protein